MEKRDEPFFTRKPYFWPVAASANVWKDADWNAIV